MVEQGYAHEWHWVWSDGWVTQFKSNKPWYFVSRYQMYIDLDPTLLNSLLQIVAISYVNDALISYCI